MCKKVISSLPRITTGILFLAAGLMKLFVVSPAMFAKEMIEPTLGMIGLVGTMALVFAWIVVVAEVLGGLALILGKLVPKKIGKILVALLVIILLVAIVFVHARMGDYVTAMKDLIILTVLLNLCPCKKTCSEGTCEIEK